MERPAHFREQIPQPMQRSSEMNAILSLDPTSIQSFPIFTTGHDLQHHAKRKRQEQRNPHSLAPATSSHTTHTQPSSTLSSSSTFT
jgi:hypothetical protein